MHKYIDYNKVRDFSKEKCWDDVYDDILENYRVTNICDDDYESATILANVLYYDYENKMVNYEAYIEKGMNARMLAELRNSALILLDKNSMDYYKGHNSLNTWQEVREFRTKYIHNLNKYYRGCEWQLYYMLLNIWGDKAKHIDICLEACFDDRDLSQQTSWENYEEDFRYVNSPAFDREHPDLVD